MSRLNTNRCAFVQAVKAMNEYYEEEEENRGSLEDEREYYEEEEENRGSLEDERSTFAPTDHSTFKTVRPQTIRPLLCISLCHGLT
jgi:hypothetical protein